MIGFGLDAGDALSLLLREERLAPQMHALTVANQERLARWEQWVAGELSEQGTGNFHRAQMAAFADGKAVPTCLWFDGGPVGSLGARLDTWTSVAEVGYWIGADHEGRGLVARGLRRLIDHLVDDRGIARIELQAAADNTRSNAVAQRLGFVLEGVRRSAHVSGTQRADSHLWGLLPADRPWQPADD